MIFDAQAGIIARIEEMGIFKVVDGPGRIVTLKDIGHLVPAAIVFPGSGELVQSAKIMERQEWFVSVIVAHESTPDNTKKTEQIAGALMAQILALHNWPPSANSLPLIYQGRQETIYYRQGWAEFIMRFQTHVILPLDAD